MTTSSKCPDPIQRHINSFKQVESAREHQTMYTLFWFLTNQNLLNANRRSPIWWHIIGRSQCNFFSIFLPQYSHRLVSSQKVLGKTKAKVILRVLEHISLIFWCSHQLCTETFLQKLYHFCSLYSIKITRQSLRSLEKNNILGLTCEACQPEQD